MVAGDSNWPPLSADRDGPTIAALHLFGQLVATRPPALLPGRNHGWHLALHLGPRGFATEPIHGGGGTCGLEFDLVYHRLRLDRMGSTLEVSWRSIAVGEF